MGGKDGLLLWILGGTGTLFIYAAYKNQTPQTLLLGHLGQTVTPAPIAKPIIPAGGDSGATYTVPAIPPAPQLASFYYTPSGQVAGEIPVGYTKASFIPPVSV
jgi:hypothetical protein